VRREPGQHRGRGTRGDDLLDDTRGIRLLVDRMSVGRVHADEWIVVIGAGRQRVQIDLRRLPRLELPHFEETGGERQAVDDRHRRPRRRDAPEKDGFLIPDLPHCETRISRSAQNQRTIVRRR
jgi:hypothetical protein